MTDGCEYRFVIEAYSPDTLPMSRLAEYMAALAQLLGRTDRGTSWALNAEARC